MNPDLALMVGVLLGPGGLSMLRSADRGREADQLCERVGVLERIVAAPSRQTAQPVE